MIKLFIAEDHALVRAGLKQLLALSADFQVVGEAMDGDTVLATLRQIKCDVLLMDMSMPGVSGIELIQRLKRLDTPPTILVLSMHNEPQIVSRALKAGASGYITKDSEPTMLLSAIRKVAAGGRYLDPQLAEQMVFEVSLNHEKPAHEALSEREFQIFRLLAAGVALHEIADQLHISAKTVSTHKIRLMQKMQLNNNAELVRYAVAHQLVE